MKKILRFAQDDKRRAQDDSGPTRKIAGNLFPFLVFIITSAFPPAAGSNGLSVFWRISAKQD
jgi:hypothetical protein